MAVTTTKKGKTFRIYKIFVIAISLAIVAFILNIAPNYIRKEITDKINLVINNSNVTKSLKSDIIIENNVVYISQDDVKNFFDDNIYYDTKYNQMVTTSDTKVAVLPINNKEIKVNGSNVNIFAGLINKNSKYYLPFSEISKSVYNVETEYIEDSNTVILTSLDRELVYANASKNCGIKWKPTMFSKNVDKVKRGDNLTVVPSKDKTEWTKVTTALGKVGYIKTSNLVNEQKVRDDFKLDKQIDGKVSIAWDYFSYHAYAPTRTGRIKGVNVVSPSFFALAEQGQGAITQNIGNSGIDYINWAHRNGHKVWPILSNDSLKDTTSEILKDYKYRETLINNIVQLTIDYNLDGINLDFENVYQADKDNYSKLVIELAPRLRELGKVLSVDVTAPDGSEDWSLCFDRHVIGKVADYIVFMAYDQHGKSSSEAGSVAAYDWVEKNINKFLKQEEVDSSKIILGIPFYTRIWKGSGTNLTSEVVSMKNTYQCIPEGTKVTWLEDEKQNFVKYLKDNVECKIWIEDNQSIKEKLKLISQYNLAGAGYWEKDREDPTIWDSISTSLDIK